MKENKVVEANEEQSEHQIPTSHRTIKIGHYPQVKIDALKLF